MESISKNNKSRVVEPEDEDGPMMVFNGPRSDEDVQFMSNWFLARRAELAREEARSAKKAE